MNVIKQYERLKVKRDLLNTQRIKKVMRLRREIRRREIWIKARYILIEAVRKTQVNFKSNLEKLVTLAIQSTINRRYKFKLLFKEKRNQLECIPIIKDGSNIYDDLENDFGGSVLDIIATAFRIVFRSMEEPKTRPIIIMDEPVKNIGSYVVKFGEMIKELSRELGLQFIIVTHYNELAEIADRAFKVSKNGKCSKIRRVYNGKLRALKQS